MNIQEFYKYIKHHNSLNEQTLIELKDVIDRYPYFQAARMLYLKNLFLLNDDRYQAMLTKTSIYIPNRKALYFLINPKDDVQHNKLHKNIEIESKKTSDVEKSTFLKNNHITNNETVKLSTNNNSSDNVNINLKQEYNSIADPLLSKINENKKQSFEFKQTDQEKISDLRYEQKNIESLLLTFDEWLHFISLHKEKTQEKPEGKTNSEESLIDQFLKNASSLARIKVEKNTVNEDLTKQLIPAEELEIVSESLAQLYYKQGYFDKALKIYEKIILNNPEKSIYFAPLIQEIKNKLKKS